MASILVTDIMTVRYDILHGGLLLPHAVLTKWEAHFYPLSVVNKGERRGEKKP